MADYNSAYTGAEIDQGVGNGLAAPTTYAPIAHDSAATTYGKGTDTKYGHLKLSASTSSTSGTSGGIAATPSAVKAAYDLANGKQSPATTLAGYGITDAATSAELGTFVRPNLLDNWYFIGGGSQQGGGQFPINQRGETTYTGAVYGIDRWKALMANMSVGIEASGLKVLATANIAAANRLLYQELEGPAEYGGNKVTLSVLVSAFSGSGIRASIRYVVGGQSTNASVTIDGTGLYTVTATIPTGVTSVEACLLTLADASMTSGSYVTIAAIKAEIGSTQTLAHQENGVWVVNEIPNYEQELIKCQSYQIRIGYRSGANYANPIGSGYAISETAFRAFVPLPATMRASPSITYFGAETVNKFVVKGEGVSVSATAASCIGYESGVMILITTTGLTADNAYALQINSANGVLLDANL